MTTSRVQLTGIGKRFGATAAHAWPEMLRALKAGGVSNYSIRELDDRLIGVFDVEGFDRFREHMAAEEVNARWQTDMARLIDPRTDPATGFNRRLEEVFRLD
jgi:L-rhamnose mutarotase